MCIWNIPQKTYLNMMVLKTIFMETTLTFTLDLICHGQLTSYKNESFFNCKILSVCKVHYCKAAYFFAEILKTADGKNEKAQPTCECVILLFKDLIQ